MKTEEKARKASTVGIICTEMLSCMFWILLILACCNRDPVTAIKALAMRSLLYVLRVKEIRRWENDD